MKKRFSLFMALTLCIVLLAGILCPTGANAAQSVPYRIKIDWEHQPIYTGVGYDYVHIRDIRTPGIYTITQEVWDAEGYLWGLLQSGQGWVDLTSITGETTRVVPYIQRVPEADQEIYEGPGYSFRKVGTVEIAAHYTIVEEFIDTDNHTWGKLKSGAGWIDLTDVYNTAALKASYFLQYIYRADQPIYSEPTYDSKYVGTVGEAGTYTIIDEAWDSEGNRWGKLKSEIGWVDLMDIANSAYPEGVSFLQYVYNADQPIYSEPTYSSKKVGTVGEAGTYTIIAEVWDTKGNRWGKLKSEKGWIDLTNVAKTAYSAENSFRQNVRNADQPIFSEPTYDSTYKGTVEIGGIYTIVAESWDAEGNHWGKLKSGAGWIDLTDACDYITLNAPVSAGYADEDLLGAGHEEYIDDDFDIATYVIFHVYENVTDVCLTSLVWETESYEVDRILYIIPRLKAGEPFVAALPFYGDMTAYGLSLTDNEGTEHFYAVTISMRNGMLEFNEYVP